MWMLSRSSTIAFGSCSSTRCGIVRALSTNDASSIGITMSTGPTTSLKETNKEPAPPPKLSHRFAVCMVPPENAVPVWQRLAEIRSKLRDPEFYRWPPRADLLYPFVDPYNNDNNGSATTTINESILEKLRLACQAVEPFTVTLHEFGTSGGANDGILWLKPEDAPHGRLVDLHASLVLQFPYHDCATEQQQQQQPKAFSSSSSFAPHITVGRFGNRSIAMEAQTAFQARKPPEWSTAFTLREIYLLGLNNTNDQFARIATIGLGSKSTVTCHATEETKGEPLPFRHMPDTEADWVRDERENRNERKRRNNQGVSFKRRRENRRKRRKRKGPDSWSYGPPGYDD